MNEKDLSFRSADGERLTATICLPDHLVGRAMLVHGITSEKEEAGFYTSLASMLAQRGIASIRANWRCHGGNSLPTEQLSLAGMINDLNAAHEAFANACNDDATPFGLVAASFGGGASILWAANRYSKVRYAVLLAPVLDYSADLFRRGQWDQASGLTDQASQILAQEGSLETSSVPMGRAMINDLPNYDIELAMRSLSCRKTIFHGTADSDVKIELSEPYDSAIYQCTLERVPGVDHGFVEPGTDFNDPKTKQHHARILPEIAETMASGLA